MKNFTKQNIKQFTSRLSARWLIMALMLLLGTSSAWAAITIYFDNTNTKWSNVYIYLYSSTYWDSNNGSGASNIKWCNNGQPMTHIGNNIYSFSYDGTHSGIVAFTEGAQCGYNNFWETKACYSGTEGLSSGSTTNYSTSKPCFKPVTDGSFTKNQGKTTYYKGTWVAYASTYTISYNSNGGTGTIASQNKTKGTPITLSNGSGFSKTGYTLDSWNTNSAGTGTKYALSASYTTDAALTLYAQWKADTYAIKYDANGGEGAPSQQTKTYGQNLTLSSTVPTRTGYTFQNWNTKADGSGTSYAKGGTYTTNAAATLYAQWTAKTYTITYKDKGGANFSGTHANGYPTTHTYGTATTLKTASKAGYTFEGWFTDSNCTQKVTSLGATDYTSAITLYAKWTANTYSITYKDQGGTNFSGTHETGHPTTHTYGTATTLKSASKAGYTFGGWFTTSACTGTKLTQLSATDYTSAITLYAKWECTQSATEGTGSFSNGTITLSAKFNTCGSAAYIGFQWKKKDDVWCYTNDGTEKCYIALDKQNKSNEVVETSFNKINKNELSGTYVFRPYIVVGNKAEEWLYGEDFTVGTCTSLTAPQLTITPITECNSTYTSGKIVIEGYDATTYTYVLKKGGDTVNKNYNNGYTIANGEEGDYTVVMDLKAGGSCKSVESTGSVNIVDNTPVVETLTMPKDFEACNGQSVTVALQNFTKEEGCSYQFTWQYSTNGGTSYTTGTVSNSATSYTRTLNGTTKFRVQVTKSKDGCTSPVATSDAVTVTANSLSAPTVSITSASYDMNAKTFTVSGRLDDAGCSQDIYVGYQYKLSNDDTWKSLVNTHHLTGADAKDGAIFTKDDIEITNATSGQKYIFRTYAINGYSNYEESSAVYSSNTIEVEVKDGYTVYVRRPKNGEDIYTKWYELSSVKGGLSYVKSGPISGTGNNDNQATTNNTGGTEMSYAFTDCDGYTWDSFKPEEGQTKFYIHALNDDAQNGWATFSQTATITSGQDNYFILSSWNNQYGVPITSTNQPTLGITIKALGSKEVISTNMASFAALYLYGNCTGKDFPRDADGVPTNCFQWKYSSDNGATWSNYSGAGATWNNIRPTAAGSYKLVCTMNDNTTAESDTIKITTKSVTYADSKLINIESALPIIMVNTGDNKGFPGCSVAGNDYPSKHADKFKKKLSVDVKIKVGENIVYDKKARMAYRGSSSLNFKKKSYAFCPGADMCGLDEDKSPDYVDTKKIDMLDIITGGTKKSAKDKDWVLYAATPDPSMMRNILAMETFSAMTEKWGVKNQYVELYIDGEYQGVYVFMDKITQNEKRVNVSWKVDGSSKGFIVKFDKTDLADRYEIPNGDQKTFESAMKTGNTGVISYGTEIDQRFEIEYPEKDKVIKEGGSWADVYTFVKGKIDAFESALKDGDFNTVRTIIDYESWADFFILTEFAKNGDGFRASCVFVYEGGLLRAYPLWDYELSFNNETRQEHGIQNTTGLLVKETSYSKVSGNGGTFPAPFWWTGNYYNQKTYKGLLDDPCFIAMVKARWNKHTTGDGALTKTKMKALVSAYNTALTTTDATSTYNTPQKREQLKWPYNGDTRGLTCNGNGIGYYGKGAGGASSKEVGYYKQNNVEGSLDQLNAWIGDSGRRGGLNKEIDDLAKDIKFAITVVADKTTTTPWRPVTVTVNSNSGYEYSITPEPAKLEENGHIYTLYFARPERTEGQNFTTVEDAYTFTATTGQADQCGTTQGSTTSAEVKIDLADVVENCQQP